MGRGVGVAGARWGDADRAVESGTVGPIVRPTFDQAGVLGSLDGVVARTKQLTGVDPPGVAFTTALGARLGSVQRRVLAGGRGLIQASTAANHASVGWRRVTDGNPCAFCAMLAGRGPVYNSAESADGFHNLCGCTVEEVFGDWVPSAQEERFRELYAASAGGTPGEVLARMRANGQGIINDAAVPATQTSGSGGGARKPPKRQSSSGEDGAARDPYDIAGVPFHRDNAPSVADVATHIFDGHFNPKSGGTQFPATWTTSMILDLAQSVLVDPSLVVRGPDFWVFYGTRDGVRLLVRAKANRVVTAHPLDGVGVTRRIRRNGQWKVVELLLTHVKVPAWLGSLTHLKMPAC